MEGSEPNALTSLVLRTILDSRSTVAWLQSADSGERIKFMFQERIYHHAIVAEYSAGIDGALALCVSAMLDDAYARIDWAWIHTMLLKQRQPNFEQRQPN